jgi:outer membrane protein assembly factor BamE
MRFYLFILTALLAACGSLRPSMPTLTPYKIEVQQGNLITPEMRDKIKIGMPSSVVRSILGNPLIMDPFHAKRWDYIYILEQSGRTVAQQRLTLYFEDDRLSRIDDSHMPAATPASK